MNRYWAWAACVIFMFGCGRETDSHLDEVAREEPLLQFATMSADSPPSTEPQSYLVAFRQALSDERLHFAGYKAAARAHNQAFGASFSGHASAESMRYLSSLNLSDLAHSFVAVTNWNQPALLQARLQVQPSMASLTEVIFANDAVARVSLKSWFASDRIWYAEPNGISRVSGTIEDAIIKNFKDNKQNVPWLAQVDFLTAIQGLSLLTSVAEPVIAVMDSGVDVLHPNLRDAIYVNDQGQNKLCRDDLYGCNTTVAKKEILGDGAVYPTGTADFNTSCEGVDECEHGTHVAGIIAARDSTSFVGLCPYCKILVVKVVELGGASSKKDFAIKDTSIIAGLAYISGFKVGGEPLVRVINASFGKFEKSRSVELFIKALKSFGRGTLTIAAAGNEDTMKRQYPAGFDAVMAVSNVVSDALAPSKSASSNFGVWVDIAAPGDGECPSFGGSGILSTVPGSGSRCKVGTSMAAPMVAGIAGLVLAKEPNLTAEQLEERLLNTAVPDYIYKDTINNGYRPSIDALGLVPLLGSGVVNANLALNPVLNASPAIRTQHSDRVQSGCGMIGGSSGMARVWTSCLVLLPILFSFCRRRRRE